MIRIDIPGRGELTLLHLVLDMNGTLAVDGMLVSGVRERIEELARTLDVHVLTADTFGRAAGQLEDLPVHLTILPEGGQAAAKEQHIRSLGVETTVAVGNGANDARMLGAAALGVAVILSEGAAATALLTADVVVTDIRDALDLLLHPRRLVATLRR